MTWLLLLRRFWWALPLVALAGGLVVTRARLADTRATLAAERTAWSAEVTRAEQQQLRTELRYQQQVGAAAGAYADRLAVREPVIVRSTDTVRTYAQTDAGRAPCLGPERVRGIDALDAELAGDPGATPGGADAVPANSDLPPD